MEIDLLIAHLDRQTTFVETDQLGPKDVNIELDGGIEVGGSEDNMIDRAKHDATLPKAKILTWWRLVF